MDSAKDTIKMYMHCNDCMLELPDDLSPQENIHIEVGINYDNLLQINCIRHDKILGTFDIGELSDVGIDDEHCCSCDGHEEQL
tara:strand:+ start:944 stop:1192 length:249 start_codon:yes stop_codon:yes gene_type:complete